MAKKMKAYCNKCKRDVEMDECREVAVERNKKLFSGTCPECGTNIMHQIEIQRFEVTG